MAKVKWVLEYTEMFLDLFFFRQNITHHAKSTVGLSFSIMNLNHFRALGPWALALAST